MANQLPSTTLKDIERNMKFAQKYVAICEDKIIAEAESITDAYAKAAPIAKGREVILRCIPLR